MTENQAWVLQRHTMHRTEAVLLLDTWAYDHPSYMAQPQWVAGQPTTMWRNDNGALLILRGMCTFQLYVRGVKVGGCRTARNLQRLLDRAAKAAA